MSQENVEVVRQALTGLSRDAAQEPTLTSFVERLSPDVEFVEDPRFPEAGTYHGRAEYLRYAREFVEQFDQLTFAVEGLRDIPDGRVLVCLHLHGRGSCSSGQSSTVSIHPTSQPAAAFSYSLSVTGTNPGGCFGTSTRGTGPTDCGTTGVTLTVT